MSRKQTVSEDELYHIPGWGSGVADIKPLRKCEPERKYFHYDEVDGHTRLLPEQESALDSDSCSMTAAFYAFTKTYMHRGAVNGCPVLAAAVDGNTIVACVDPKVYRRQQRNYSPTFAAGWEWRITGGQKNLVPKDPFPVRYLSPQEWAKLTIEKNEVQHGERV